MVSTIVACEQQLLRIAELRVEVREARAERDVFFDGLTTADLRRALVAAKAIGVPRGPLLEQWLLCGKFGEEGGEEGVSAAAAAVVVRAARSTAAAATALHEEAVEAVLRDELRSLQMQRDFLVKCRALDTDRALSKSTAQLSSMLSAKEKFSCPPVERCEQVPWSQEEEVTMRMYRHINGALGHVSSSCVLPTEALVHHEAMDVERRTHDGDVALPWREHCISCHVYLGTVREEPPPLPTSTRAKTKGLLSWLHRKKAALRQRQHSTRLMRDYVKVL